MKTKRSPQAPVSPNGQLAVLQQELKESQARLKAQTAALQNSIENEKALTQKYSSLLDSVHDIIYSSDLMGNFTSINKLGEVVSGYPHDESLGMNIKEVLTPDEIERFADIMRRARLGKEPPGGEIRFLAKGGRPVLLEINQRLTFEHEQPAGIQCVARDVGE